jgi:DNA-binding HxlR family transcriptional regulator
MHQRRSYDDACGAAHALDLVGERWTLLVMRELMFGPKRFSDLRTDLPGISANMLQQRLEGLEATGVVRRRKLPPPASVQIYELTEWGYESEPILQALGRWATRSPKHDPTLPISTVSVLLSFRTMFSPERAQGETARIGLRIGDETFVASVGNGRIAIETGETLEVDVVLSVAKAAVLAGAVYGGQSLRALEAGGDLTIAGDRAIAKRFVAWFPLPAKVKTHKG